MKISTIRQQVKRPDRYSIYVDGAYIFSLSEGELLKTGLRIGQELTATELDDLKKAAVYDKAYYRSLNLLSRRPRSEWEMRSYLERKAYDNEIIETTIGRLSQAGYLDDTDFARRWVENRRLLKPISRRRLSAELRQKRVADEAINQALEQDETDEQAVLRELVAKKRRQSKYQDDQKLMQYLARQGYNFDDIKSALSEED